MSLLVLVQGTAFGPCAYNVSITYEKYSKYAQFALFADEFKFGVAA